jgi:hypothetical protein
VTNPKLSTSPNQPNDKILDEDGNPISFDSILNMFQYRITCLATALNMIQISEHQAITAHSLKMYDRAKANNYILNEELKEDKKEYTFSIPVDDVNTARAFYNHQINIATISHASYIMRRNLIVSLVSEVDNLITALIKLGFSIHPNILDSSDRKFTLSELSSFSTMNDAREHLIEKEIETVLRDSHAKQFDYIQKKFSLKELHKIPGWDSFVEITERRNVFVHCDGKISRQYLAVCQQNKILLPEDYKLGVQLDVDASYFAASYKNILKVGVILTHKMWRQFKTDEHSAADELLNNLCLQLISIEDYDLAIELLNYNETNFFTKKTNQRMRMVSIINKAQAYKWKKDKSRMNQTLSKLDFSAVNDDFKLAELVLKDDFEEAAKIVEKIGSKSEYVNEEAYKEWPIFKELRKSEKFADAFEVVFNKKFNLTVEENTAISELSLDISKSDGSNSVEDSEEVIANENN